MRPWEGVTHLRVAMGGSMGAMNALEWGATYPAGPPHPSSIHFSPQPPFSSLKFAETTQRVPQKVLTSCRKVDECKPPGFTHG